MDTRKLTAVEKMKRARSQLLMYHPFFGYLSTKLRMTEVPVEERKQRGTLATDGDFMWYNPEFVDKLTNEQGLTAVCHEVMHNVCGHLDIDRQGGRDTDRWQQACDYAINATLVANKFEPINIPGVFQWLFDPGFAKMSAEEIYTKLPKDQKKPPTCGMCPKGTKGAGAEGPAAGKPDPAAPPQKVDWKQATAEAAAYARGRGSLPAGIEELVDKVLNPPVDWKRVIRGEFSKAIRQGWDFARPNRRYAAFGMAMPSVYGYTTVPEVWGDSSGSMYGRWPEFLGVVLGIARSLHVTVDVGIADAKIQAFHRKVRTVQDAKAIAKKGGGGTDFRPMFEDAKKRKPASLVFFTDGMGSMPERKPPYPVLWVVPEEYKSFKPPFGRKVVVPKEAIA
jgi:predicted metal-dependent peptidase